MKTGGRLAVLPRDLFADDFCREFGFSGLEINQTNSDVDADKPFIDEELELLWGRLDSPVLDIENTQRCHEI